MEVWRNALAPFEEAYALYRDSPEALVGLVLANTERFHRDEALELLRRAADGAVSVGDPALRARVLLTESEAFQAIDEPARALDAATAALEAVSGHDSSIEEFHARLRLIQLLDGTATGDDHVERAVTLADALALPHLRYPLLVELARQDRDRGDDEGARARLEQAIDIIEGLRGLIADESLRANYLEGRTAAHLDLISMLLDGPADDVATAFDLAEASKSRTLDDIMTGSVRPASTVHDEPDERLARHEADLNAAYSALTAVGGDRTRRHRRALLERTVELERAIRLARLQSESAAEPTPTERRNGQDRRPTADERVVEYHIVDQRVVAFVWQKGRLELCVRLQ